MAYFLWIFLLAALADDGFCLDYPGYGSALSRQHTVYASSVGRLNTGCGHLWYCTGSTGLVVAQLQLPFCCTECPRGSRLIRLVPTNQGCGVPGCGLALCRMTLDAINRMPDRSVLQGVVVGVQDCYKSQKTMVHNHSRKGIRLYC